MSWIWFPLTQTAHHPWTTFPIMHCTHTFPSTITPITQLSPFTHQLWLPHHTCTSFSHSHKSSTQTLTQGEVLFSPGYISERSPIHPAISVFHPGLPDLGSLNLCLWPRLLPGIVYVSALPLIFLFLPADLACLILPIKYCCKWIHSPLTIPYNQIPNFLQKLIFWIHSFSAWFLLHLGRKKNLHRPIWPRFLLTGIPKYTAL